MLSSSYSWPAPRYSQKKLNAFIQNDVAKALPDYLNYFRLSVARGLTPKVIIHFMHPESCKNGVVSVLALTDQYPPRP